MIYSTYDYMTMAFASQVFVSLLTLVPIFAAKDNVDVTKTFVYGPGLHRDIVLPVRYFYVQFVNKKGKNMTTSVGKENIKVDYSSPNSGRVRAWPDLLDRNDGSFIVRFRLMETYRDLTISITYKGKHIADSPYAMKGQFYHEQCNCPQQDEEKWLEVMKCPQTYGQIGRDFEKFPVIDLKRLRKEGFNKFTSEAVCHYSIIKGKIYRRCPGSITDFKMFVDAFLLSVLRKVNIPDVEFFANLGDWPLEKNLHDPMPIISWCGSEDSADIIWPTYDLTQATLEALGRQSMDMMSVQGNTGPKWKSKIGKAVFRGRDSRQERLDLVVMGRKKPELYDVALSNFFFFKYEEEKYGPKQRMSFFDFFKYKYQLNIDGTVAAYRFPYLLVGDAAVFKQDSPYYEHFYKDLTPGVHYIEFKRDLSDLEEKLRWAKKNDDKVRKIAKAGQTFARDNLMPDHMYCYTYLVFKEYAKRQNSKPRIHKDMEVVKQPEDHDAACDCKRKGLKKDEL